MTLYRHVRGIRDKIPSGYLLGRSAKGEGHVELIKASDFITPHGVVVPPSAITITLTGDVTGSGSGSIATTIANDAVSNAKLANMAAWTVKVRNAGTSGDPSDAALADFTEEAAPEPGDFILGFLASGELRKFDFGNVSADSYIPLVDGSEPPMFITDGAGVLIVVPYSP